MLSAFVYNRNSVRKTVVVMDRVCESMLAAILGPGVFCTSAVSR